MFRALPSREDLARIDPYTLGEAVASQLHALDENELRAFAHTCATRFDGYYRTEIKRALAENPSDGAVLRDAMIAFFRGNPRAIERCEAPFVAAALRTIPETPEQSLELDGEETRPHKPLMLALAIGLVLLGAGAALDRLAFAVHSSSNTSPEPILVYVTPAPAAVRTAHRTLKKPVVKAHVVAAQPVYVPPARRFAQHPAIAPKHRAIAPKHVAVKSAPKPKPKTQQKPKQVVTAPVRVSQRGRIRHGPVIRVAVAPSSTPVPRRRSWLQRQLDHLNPFKRHPDVQYQRH